MRSEHMTKATDELQLTTTFNTVDTGNNMQVCCFFTLVLLGVCMLDSF